MPGDAPYLSGPEGRARIEHEDNLVNHRVSWLIGSQSFLFTAFVLLRNNPAFYNKESATAPGYEETTARLVYYISSIGLAIATCSFIGVLAAFFAIRAWKAAVREGERRGLTSKARIAHFGGLAAILPGPVIAAVWAILLAAEWSRISKTLSTVEIWTPIGVALLTGVTWFLFHWKVFLLHPRDSE